MPERLRARFGQRGPLVWVLLTPVVTVPLSALLIVTLGGEHEAEALGLPAGDLCRFQGHLAQVCFYYFDFWRTALLFAIPGVLNLLAALWLLDRNGYIRVAAVLALVLAAVRTLITPMATLAVSQFEVFREGGLWLRVDVAAGGVPGDISSPGAGDAVLQLLVAVWVGGAVMWALSALVSYAFEPLMARYWRSLNPPGGEERRTWRG